MFLSPHWLPLPHPATPKSGNRGLRMGRKGLTGTRADVPTCPTKSHWDDPGKGQPKVLPAHQRFPQIPKIQHQIPARVGPQSQELSLGNGPQAGISPRAGKNPVGTRANVELPGRIREQMKTCGSGAVIPARLLRRPFGDENPSSFMKDLSSLV